MQKISNTNNFALAQFNEETKELGFGWIEFNQIQLDLAGYCFTLVAIVVEMEMFWFTHMCHYKFCMDSLAQSIAAVSVLCCGLLRQLLQFGRSTPGGTSAQTGHEISSKDPKKQHS